MTKIKNYIEDTNISEADILLGTDKDDALKTKNYKIGRLKDYILSFVETIVGPQGPQGIQGEVGPQGATGPQGPQGESGTASLPYKSYIGYIQFSTDGNALNTEIFNDLESGIYFSLNSTGVYVISVYTSEFTTKTIISPFDRISGNPAGVRLPIFNNTTGLIVGYYTINRWNSSTTIMHFWDTSNNLVNPYTLLGTRAILADIKVYN